MIRDEIAIALLGMDLKCLFDAEEAADRVLALPVEGWGIFEGKTPIARPAYLSEILAGVARRVMR